MTNFNLEKDKIWNAAKNDDRQSFDMACNALMQKAMDDWWRIGWSIAPKDVNELVTMIDDIAKRAHKEWLAAMKRGDAPSEDVSPGEGFALCSTLIKDELQKLDEMRNEI